MHIVHDSPMILADFKA